MRPSSVIRSFVLGVFVTVALAATHSAQATLTSDLDDYEPGSYAALTGSGFAPGEPVMMQVVHADGTPSTGQDHDPWYVTADAAGNFATAWHVCEDDCVGSQLRAFANGQSSGAYAEVLFLDAGPGQSTCSGCADSERAPSNVPNYGPVVVDGNIMEWDTSAGSPDYFAPMYVAGDDTKPLVSRAYVRFVCDSAKTQGTVYVLVLAVPGQKIVEDVSFAGVCGANNWIKYCLGGSTTKLVDSCDPAFAYVNLDPPGPGVRYADGYEASFTLPASAMPYNVIFHADVQATGGGTVNTSASTGFPRNGICMVLDCPECVPTTILFSECPPDATLDCYAEMDAPASVSATDDCGNPAEVSLAVTESNSGSSCSNTVTRTWTATVGGLSATCTQTITIADTTAPTISGVGADATIDCSETPSFSTPTAMDGCDPAPALTFEDTTSTGACPQSYSVTRTWTATDACGNSSTASQTITVQDTTAPTISGVPADATVECDAVPSPAAPTASDACDPAPTLSYSESTAAGDCANASVITRTWTATDACGNSSSQSQVVTVVDTTPPVLSGVPDDASYQCRADVPDAPTVTASDNCGDATVSLEENESNPGSDCQNTITRTWTATDACGNTSSMTQTIQVDDTTPPEISCPPDVEISSDPDSCLALVDAGMAVATDNCTVESLVSDHDGQSMFPVGDTMIVWTATDACGNTATCTQTIRVLGHICASKFHDANFNGQLDDGEEVIPGWRIDVLDGGGSTVASGLTDASGQVCFDLAAGTYSVFEVVPPENNWQSTTGLMQVVTVDADSCSPAVAFGNYCFQAPYGGHTQGFWRNKNGMNLLQANPGWRELLNGLGLVSEDGTPFQLTGSLSQSYNQLKSFLRDGTATNMAYMLSVQLASVALSDYVFGAWDASTAIVVPGGVTSANGVCTVPLLSMDQPLVCGEALLTLTAVPGSMDCGCSSNDGVGTIYDLMAKAQCLLGAYPLSLPGDPQRDYMEAVKNVLDMIANNGNNGYPCGGLSQYVDLDGGICLFTTPY